MNDSTHEESFEFAAAAAAEAPEGESIDSSSTEVEAQAAGLAGLYQTGLNGANWFYWVAGLSLVNSVILLTGGGTFFVVGLGVTLLADSIAAGVAEEAPELAQTAKIIAFCFDLFVAAVVAGFGWLSGKRYLAVFAIGMVLYLLDGLLFVLIQDWMSVGFHAFALFCMAGGFKAFLELNKVEAALRRQAEFGVRGDAVNVWGKGT